MELRDASRSLALLLALGWAALALPTETATASEKESPTVGNDVSLSAVVERYHAQLSRLSSDADALTLYREEVSQALDVPDTIGLLGSRKRRRAGSRNVPPPDLTEPAMQLMSAMATWATVSSARQAAQTRQSAAISDFLRDSAPTRDWLLNGTGSRALGQPAAELTAVLEVLSAIDSDPPTAASRPADYPALTEYLDRSYPDLTGSADSWVGVAGRDGAQAIRSRLVEFWDKEDIESSQRKEAVEAYFNTRLRPVFSAQAVALSIQAETEAVRLARESWSALRSWREQWSTLYGRYRLCGTWVWIVHNHQNHQDHKMMVTFPSPEDHQPVGPGPAKIVVLGDVVYLRWEFAGGYQEDSLLFSGKGERLEGTFVNSRGPYGSITGKRTAPCKKRAQD